MKHYLRLWFSGRTRPCQGRDPGSIPGSRTKTLVFCAAKMKMEFSSRESKSGAGTSLVELVASCGHDFDERRRVKSRGRFPVAKTVGIDPYRIITPIGYFCS